MTTNDVTATRINASGRAAGLDDTEADLTKVRALTAQFESMLIAHMLREMKQAMTPDADANGLGGQIMADTVTTELGLALGRVGGLGLSELLTTALARLEAGGETSHASSGAADVVVAPPVVAPAAQVPLMTTAAVNSGYGWRVDPLNGRERFHAGLDLGVAYGRDVRAATGGVVTFAGEQGGYGLVVTLDHGNGFETRYAHLSAADVREGETVSAGEVIARSGNSGRSTGPHLHFEVRHHGQPVDPALVAGLVPVADFGGDDTTAVGALAPKDWRRTADSLRYRSQLPGPLAPIESDTR